MDEQVHVLGELIQLRLQGQIAGDQGGGQSDRICATV